MEFFATLFDGQSSRGRSARVIIDPDGTLHVQVESGEVLSVPKSDYSYTPPVGRGPLRFALKSNVLVETPYNQEAAAHLLDLATDRHRFISISESKFRYALGLSSAAIALFILIYLFGLPLLTKFVQPLIPHTVKESLGDHMMVILDKVLLHPTKLPDNKQQDTERLFLEVAEKSALSPNLKLLYRRFSEDEKDIANAFAILPFTVVVTDGLVETLSPDEVQAVLGHELGHLHYDHGTQILLRSSLLSMAFLLLFGGDPGTIQGLAVSVMEANYSQDQERQADFFGASLLRDMGKSPRLLGEALKKISKGQGESDVEKYFSSHPLTSERVKYLEEFE